MKTYESMKPSTVFWLGMIPEHWECLKIGSLFSQRKVKVSDKDYAPLSVTKMGILPQLENAAKTNDGDNRKLVCAGDFVINSRSDRKGSCGISELDGSVSLINLVLTPRSEWNNRYAHYLLRSQPFSEEYYRYGRGIVADLWTTRFSEMKNILLPVPPREEQNQIVCFLDWKVSEINRLINIKRKQIEKLSELQKAVVSHLVTKGLTETTMRPTDIYWLKEVPIQWKETKLKHILTKHNRSVPENAQLLICSNSGEVKIRGDEKIGLVAASDDIYQGVKAGDLLIHGMDTWHGAIAISAFDGMCTPVVHVCSCSQSKRFVEYYLKMMAYTKVFKAISNGVRQNTSDFRSWNKVGDLLIAFPPFEEQEQIADVIDQKIKEIASAIQKIEEKISLLEDLKNRLISDVVTGKIDVRGIEIPEYEYTAEEADTDSEAEAEEFDEQEGDE